MLGRSPAFLPLLAVIACLLIADSLMMPATYWWLLSALMAGLSVLSIRAYSSTSLFPAILLVLTLGTGSAAFYMAARLDPAVNGIPASLIDRGDVTLFGRVRGWPKVSRERTELVVDLDSIRTKATVRVHAAIQIVIADTTTFVQQWDRIQTTGRLLRPMPSSARFSYQKYLARQGIQAQLYLSGIVEILRLPEKPQLFFSIAQFLRQRLVNTLQRILPAEEASLAAGFLVGETRDLPQSTMLVFRETGTMHLLAVSGANVWLVVGFLLLVLRPVPISRVVRTCIILLSLIVFMLMCYAEPSVVRASVLVMLVLIGRLVGRRLDLLHLLTVAALLMLLLAPWQLYSIGFQLSFLTATALVALLLPLQEWLESRRLGQFVQGILLGIAGSIVASIVSAPLVWWHFERISVMSIPANILVAPLVGIATVAALTASVVYQFIPIIGVWLGTLVYLPLEGILSIVNWFGAIGDDLRIPIRDDYAALIPVVAFYLLFALLAVFRVRRQALAIAVILLVAASVYSGRVLAAGNLPGHQLRIESIPGGQLVGITRDNWRSADLCLTGLRARRYPVDSVIIVPIIERWGSPRINSLSAINFEFNAVDDLIRLRAHTIATTLIVPEEERNLIQDWLSWLPPDSSLQVQYSSSKTGLNHEGIRMIGSSYNWRDSVLIFRAGKNVLQHESISEGTSGPNPWRVMLCESLTKVEEAQSFDALFCSESAQEDSLLSQSDPLTLDLRRTGSIHLLVGERLEIRSASGKTIFRKRPNAR